ncbi:MAG: c-type cytochrome [Azospirillaceae bacterium]|nr:c-type cytochrome [Azospirillaceae bacterium]
MSSRFRNLWGAVAAAVATLVLMGIHQAGAATPPHARVCIDTASPAAAINRSVAQAVAHEAGWSLTVKATEWSEPGDDDGVGPEEFLAMARKDCDLLMGYPMDAYHIVPPPGLNVTQAYLHTGFVLVGHGAVPEWTGLPVGTTVGVTYNTPANLLLVERRGADAMIYDSESRTIAAVRSGQVPLALVWELSVNADSVGNDSLTIRHLGLPQADWVLAALYADRANDLGEAFDKALDHLRQNGQLAALTKAATPPSGPRLYAAAQAKRGAKLFADNCASCHGAQLQGKVGPALRGSAFAGPDDGYTVGSMFTYFSVQMPAGAPGSLEHDDYVALMAFLLRENGYAAGEQPLSYDGATASDVALVSRAVTAPPVQTAAQSK